MRKTRFCRLGIDGRNTMVETDGHIKVQVIVSKIKRRNTPPVTPSRTTHIGEKEICITNIKCSL